MSWLPFSVRTGRKQASDLGPHDGVPGWLRQSITEWCLNKLRPFQYEESIGLLNLIERKLRLELPLGLFNDRVNALVELVHRDGDLFIDLIELLLSELHNYRWIDAHVEAGKLAKFLDDGGSVWKVVQNDDYTYTLESRVGKSTSLIAEEVLGVKDRAGKHLRTAWQAVYGKNKNASEGYREAVRAVEAIAKPVISPKNNLATLGTMIADIKNAPAKWQFELQPKTGNAVEMVKTSMELLWTSQLDRHGTDDTSVPLTVSDEEAEAAVHLAVTLVHWFRSGAFRRA